MPVRAPKKARVDLLLQKQATGNVRRIGDLRNNAPYVMMICEGETTLLQMPTTLISGNQYMWDQTDYTADSLRGAAAMAGSRAGTDLLKDPENGWEIAKGMLSGIGKDMVSSVGSSVLGIDNYGDYRLHKKGRAVNPNKEVTFNGIGYRSFEFNFEMVALSEREAEATENFIAFVQEKAAPDFASPQKIYWQYPSTWTIIFPGKFKLPNIMPCYCTDYSVDYGAAGRFAFHESGHSTQINISVTFIEASLHTKSKAKAYPG